MPATLRRASSLARCRPSEAAAVPDTEERVAALLAAPAGHHRLRALLPEEIGEGPPAMTDVATATPVAATRRREAFRANLPAGWANAVTVLGAWVALIVATGALPRRLPVAPDRARDHFHHGDRRGARGRRKRSSASAAAFSISASPRADPVEPRSSRSCSTWTCPSPWPSLAGILAGAAWGFVNAAHHRLRQAQPDHRDARHELHRPRGAVPRVPDHRRCR